MDKLRLYVLGDVSRYTQRPGFLQHITGRRRFPVSKRRNQITTVNGYGERSIVTNKERRGRGRAGGHKIRSDSDAHGNEGLRVRGVVPSAGAPIIISNEAKAKEATGSDGAMPSGRGEGRPSQTGSQQHRAGGLGAGRNGKWCYSWKASAKRSISNKLQARRVACLIDQAMVMTRVLSRGEHRNGKGRIGIAALSHSPRPSGRMQRGAMTPCAGRWSEQRRFPVGEEGGCDEELRDKEGWIEWKVGLSLTLQRGRKRRRNPK
ncbi:hypothetical protein EDB85DRAFT_1896873 [Lactarius pseudohatsudake]|nr:hypothetical protein EDB85DRAFT_1896873 [Lactarius pseudohatsudake]